MKFHSIKEAIANRFRQMQDMELFVVDVSRHELWDTYLGSFPEGSNPIFRERTEHDCNCCKQFIRDLGKVVAIGPDNRLVSIWDIEIDETAYQIVADAMLTLIESKKIVGTFMHYQKKIGQDHNFDTENSDIRWDHFHAVLPDAFVKPKDMIGSLKSEQDASKHVFHRSMDELTLESAETVLDLVAQNSLYRGEEHKATVSAFILAKQRYDSISPEVQNSYAWRVSRELGPAGRFKNTVIGTLLADLSEGMDLVKAVKRFEDKVAPQNYKRTKSLVSSRMIAAAEAKVTELGLHDALERRYAVAGDLTINNVLFADRSVKPQMNAFAALAREAEVTSKAFDKVEEVSVEKFMRDILPTANGIELLLENKHVGNLVSLIAPVHADAPNMLKWNNNFSFSYAGEVTDAIKQRVKAAGGNVEGELRFSIQWNDGDDNQNDFDAHCIEPNSNLIYFPNNGRKHASSGMLDVDIQRPGRNVAVENITWSDRRKIQDGVHEMLVHNYSHNGGMTGFTAQVEFDGVTHTFVYYRELRQGEKVVVAKVRYDKATDSFSIESSLDSTTGSKDVWGIATNSFHKVTMLMNSPNHWDGEANGNKHWFFMLEDCVHEGKARGFYNEFLRNDLHDHRKVFEHLAAKMKTPETTDQLSGLGFSSTQTNSVTCRVTSHINRIIKINF